MKQYDMAKHEDKTPNA